jgi:hypothetical protein
VPELAHQRDESCELANLERACTQLEGWIAGERA